jgi:hypothetical protein
MQAGCVDMSVAVLEEAPGAGVWEWDTWVTPVSCQWLALAVQAQLGLTMQFIKAH